MVYTEASIADTELIDDAVLMRYFTGQIKPQFHRHRKVPYDGPSEWWSNECNQTVTSRRWAFNSYRRHRTEFNHVAYKKHEHKVQRIYKVT